ncbi:MAG: Spo0E family sporulation regulatory protein-aspartic acid phosphatase [bacterium]
MSVEQRYAQVQQLDDEIEDLRVKLHRLVSTNPARLRSGDVYKLSLKLDQLIIALQQTAQL